MGLLGFCKSFVAVDADEVEIQEGTQRVRGVCSVPELEI